MTNVMKNNENSLNDIKEQMNAMAWQQAQSAIVKGK